MKWLALCFVLVPATASAQLWEDATDLLLGNTGQWSNKVELADVDGDGKIDVLFANGGNYSSAGAPELNRVFRNLLPGQPFEEITEQVMVQVADSARVVKVGDLNADGVPDVVVGTTWQTRSRVLLGLGAGEMVEVTQTHTPPAPRSIGDLELGDVDGDGDLDVVLADWGAGKPNTNEGGRTRLWLNNGKGAFTDVTEAQMPSVLVRWSWDLELVDVDGDLDLDVLVSCKSCDGSFLFENDGFGDFSDVTEGRLPQFTNNYDFEAMDVDADGDLDLVTINDGPGLTEHVFINDGAGTFADETSGRWPGEANVGEDDNVAAFLDADSDGDADVLIGSLSGADRLLVNDGGGRFTLDTAVIDGGSTPGTLGMELADLDGDGRLDLAMAQGEAASADKLYLGVGLPDSAAPVVGPAQATAHDQGVTVRLSLHDRKTPVKPHDFQAAVVRWSIDGGDPETQPLRWFGGTLWRAEVPATTGTLRVLACATDAAGNEACGAEITLSLGERPTPDEGPVAEPPPEVEEPDGAELVAEPPPAVAEPAAPIDAGSAEDAGDAPPRSPSSGGCTALPGPSPAPLLLLLLALAGLALRPRRG